ncbi:hypothetical protein RI543_004805 [Arxiozyma heterogenica]|uniref:Uncharacterized protein n=1 Tax=Arxiozyma heterogenica TaxID=278026 RepID=A0AAN7WGH5_9SACH|nr:hypothetical protein RI543_004805 [Kazachstania heterogenica]
MSVETVMEDDLLSPENVVLLYVFWSSIDYSDLPRSYVIQSFYYAASNVVAHVWLINTLIGSRFIQDLIIYNLMMPAITMDAEGSKFQLVLSPNKIFNLFA